MLSEKRQPFDFEYYFNNPNGYQGVKLFIETFLWIRTKDKGLHPFFLNNIQKWYLRRLTKKYWKAFTTKDGKVRYRFEGIREICLKARQFGLSTLICAIFFYDTICNESTTTAVFCQDDTASKKMLQKYKLFYAKIPDSLKPALTVDNVTTMGFGGLSSLINSETPGSSKKTAEKQGRSETIRNIHASEFAEWAEAEATLGGLLDTVPDSGNIIIESSAKKVGDYFHIVYQKGKEKINNSSFSEWNSVFFPWYKFSENRVRLKDFQLELVKNNLTDEEKAIIKLYNLDYEQIAWRRKQIDKKFGNIKAFLREHPEDDISCFESNSELVFSDHVRRITCQAKEPVPGHLYCIGCDIGGGGIASDDSSIVVIDTVTREQVYQRNLICKPTELIPIVFDIWKKYPGFVGIESNNDVGLSALSAAFAIPEWSKYLFSNNKKRGGFWTGANKRAIIDALVFELQQVSQGFPGLLISSSQIVLEMNWFQVLEDGSYGAPPRTSENRDNPTQRLTDDSIMGLMIAYEMMKYTFTIMEDFYEDYVLPELKKNKDLFVKDEILKKTFERYLVA